MNFVGHVVVAERVAGGASTARLLGAAAPDLARMAGLPVAVDRHPEVAAGVGEHHRADAAFHELTWFRGRHRALATELQARGVRRGTARGAGHVLVELLLDGALLADGTHQATFGRAWEALAEAGADARAMVPSDGEARWVDFLRELTRRLDPAAYAEPIYAADRTAGTLARRPRLAMLAGEVEVLRAVATEAAVGIAEEAETVVAAVSAGS